MSKQLSKTHIWRFPVTIGLLCMVGLLAALIADGMWDALSWVTLAMPVLICLYFTFYHKSTG